MKDYEVLSSQEHILGILYKKLLITLANKNYVKSICFD